MEISNLTQGSPEWLSYRATKFNASDAPAMMNCSPYKTRTQLLTERKTGLTHEIDASTQRIFNDGHRFEALARPLAEKILGEDLFPVTGCLGKLSASFDGLAMDETVAWEHKTLNDKLRAVNSVEDLPLHYRVQMEQQLLVSGAESCLFMATKWDGEELVDEKHFVYEEDNKLRYDIIMGWEQFETDLLDHEPAVIVEAPKAEPVLSLPSVVVQVKGELTLCNIDDIRPAFDKFLLEATVNLVTDNDFAQAEAESKVGRDVAKRCLATAKGVIDQTASISEVTRELELYAAKFNALALSQEKAVKTQKEARKLAIMNDAKIAFTAHCDALEIEIKPIRLITEQPNFPEAMKNKRLLSAIQDGVDSELARVKILADGVARGIRVNLALMTENAPHQFLFNDLNQIIYKPFDDLKLLVASRIESHEKVEAERVERIRLAIEAEAKRKAEAEQAAKLEQERAKIREEERVKAQAEQDRIDRIKQEEAEAKRLIEQAEIEVIRHQAAIKSVEKPMPVETHFRDDSFEVLPNLISPAESLAQYSSLHILGAVAKYLNLSQSETADILDSIDWQAVKEQMKQAA